MIALLEAIGTVLLFIIALVLIGLVQFIFSKDAG